MLKNKIPTIFVFFSLVLLLSACSNFSNNPGLETVPSPSVTEPPQNIKNAEFNFEEGKSMLLMGNLDEARVHFEKTLDLLMDSGTRTPEQMKLLDNYIKQISDIELDHMSVSAPENNGEHEAFLDEVLSTPLFKPSKNEILKLQEKMGEKDRQVQYSIPITINATVVSFLKAFQNTRSKNIQNALNRSVEYVEEFKRIFKENDVPEDLAYLPMIESGYRIEALSRARACGVWQFMASTARLYGLRVDRFVDERKDPFKSAVAAAKYLKRLYEDFGDWYIAMACYNGGTVRVKRAIKKLKTNDFFTIAKSKQIRKETRNYVPAFLAALIIAKEPETYGFNIEPQPSLFENTRIITVPSPVSLKEVASKANISYEELRYMNPELVRDFTPFNSNTYSLRVPTALDETLLADIKKLPPNKKYFDEGSYTVKRGDSLYSIARKFNTTVNKIKSANRMRTNRLNPGKRLVIPQ